MEDIINILNGDDEDRLKSLFRTFDGVEVLMKVLAKRNLLDRLNYNSPLSEYWISEWIEECVEKDPQLLTGFIERQFDDIIIQEGQPKLRVWNLKELSQLFDENSRGTLSRRSISVILSGDYQSDSYFDVEVDYWLPELNKKNLEYLKELVIFKLQGVEVEPNTETLLSIAEAQDSDYVTVDENYIGSIFHDFKSVEYIFEEYLDDLNSDIRSTYLNAYDCAWSDTLYNDVMGEIESEFGKMKIERGFKFTKYIFDIPNFWREIKDYSEDIENYSYYVDFFNQYNSISYYPPDYPDSKYLHECFNDYFAEVG